MRRVLLIALFLIPVSSLGIDSTDAEPVQILEDEIGDVMGATPAGLDIPGPIGLEHLDLQGLVVHETATTFDLEVHVAGGRDNADYNPKTTWGLTHGTTEFMFELDESILYTALSTIAPQQDVVVQLRRPVGGTAWEINGLHEYTSTDTSISVSVNKEHFTDESGAPPLPGSSLTSFWAATQDWPSDRTSVSIIPGPGFVVEWYDQMPQTGTTGEFPVQFGLSTNNDLLLSSPEPRRVSNGEEATYVYEVYAQNLAAETRTFTFEAIDIPDQWSVDLPIQATEVEPHESVLVPVIVSTPFRHEHGTTVQFNVSADGVTSSSQAILELGVYYTSVPQPSGHHQDIYIHSGQPEDETDLHARGLEVNDFMSTLSDDPGSFQGPLGPNGNAYTGSYTWCMRLTGGMGMGLDLTGEDAVFNAEFTTSGLAIAGQLDLTLSVRDTLDDPRVESAICTDGIMLHKGTAQLDIPMQSSVQVSMPLPASTDRVSPDARSMTLGIEFTPNVITERQVDAVWIEPGAVIHLALSEYHAEPLELGELGALMQWQTQSIVSRAPGAVAVLPFTTSIQNPDFEVLGTRPEWAQVRGPIDGQYALVVTVPSDAGDEQANLVLRAAGDGVGLLRAVVTVEDSATDDDAELLVNWEQAKSTPAFGLLAALAATGTVLLSQRRRMN
jgi:hypothetical protein